MNKLALEILTDRENRVAMQEELLENHNKTLICLRVNYPGVYKDNELSRKIFFSIEKIIEDIFVSFTHLKILKITSEGPTEIFLVDKDSREVKEITAKIEETYPLGRFADIDVYDSITKESISRKDLGMEERKCYLCDNKAHICVRSKSHSQGNLISYMEKVYDDFKRGGYDRR